MTDAELAAERKLAHDKAMAAEASTTGGPAGTAAVPSSKALVLAFWVLVGIPLAWGVSKTLQKAWVLFH